MEQWHDRYANGEAKPALVQHALRLVIVGRIILLPSPLTHALCHPKGVRYPSLLSFAYPQARTPDCNPPTYVERG